MLVSETKLQNLLFLKSEVHRDERGFLLELFNERVFSDAGVKFSVVQHNQSRSRCGVVRGLHFQWDKPLSKLIRVVCGRAFMVAVDIRKHSKTRGQWEAKVFDGRTPEIMWAPFGFATGFCALEDNTDIEYYYSAHYNKDGESNIVWNDPDIGIAWPEINTILSPRDAAAQSFKAWLGRKESNYIV